MSDQPKELDFGKVFREKLERAMASTLTTPKIAKRNAIGMGIMAIVERQIGKGESDTADAWARLHEVVAGNPAAEQMVTDLEGALKQYEADIQKQIQAGADEAQARKTSAAVIKMAIMMKMQPPTSPDDPAAAPAAEGEGEGEGEAEKAVPAEPKAGS